MLPTDTVYGLACTAGSETAAVALYRLKGRDAIQPTAALFAGLDVLLESLPELGEAAATAARMLLPGPYTLVVPNPERRFGWLNGEHPEAVGVRVPELPPVTARDRLDRRRGRGDERQPARRARSQAARRRAAEIRRGVAVAVDGGELPGTPSTVIDLTGAEPVVLRAGAADPEAALRRIAEAYR